MTQDRRPLSELLEKAGADEFVRDMIGFVAQHLRERDVDNRCGAGHGERSEARTNSRNGFRDRQWDTRAGSVARCIPKLRAGSDFPPFLEPRRTAEKALAAVLQEAYVQGLSTRSVDDLVQAMGMSGIAKSQVSRLCAEIDERVQTFLARPIEGDWPYLWIDATDLKVRQAGRIVSIAAIIAIGANSDGRPEVLGRQVGASEVEPFWTDFRRTLTRRGLRGVKRVISDAHEGLKAAVRQVISATWQRCRVHFMRNVLVPAPSGQRRMVSALIATIFAQETEPAARDQWRTVTDQLRERFPKIARLMDDAEDDVLAHMAFPREHWCKIHRTNPLERLNGEIKRRTDVVGIFPNEAAIYRLVGALLLEQNDAWALPRRYMTLETLAGVGDNSVVSLSAVTV